MPLDPKKPTDEVKLETEVQEKDEKNYKDLFEKSQLSLENEKGINKGLIETRDKRTKEFNNLQEQVKNFGTEKSEKKTEVDDGSVPKWAEKLLKDNLSLQALGEKLTKRDESKIQEIESDIPKVGKGVLEGLNFKTPSDKLDWMEKNYTLLTGKNLESKAMKEVNPEDQEEKVNYSPEEKVLIDTYNLDPQEAAQMKKSGFLPNLLRNKKNQSVGE